MWGHIPILNSAFLDCATDFLKANAIRLCMAVCLARLVRGGEILAQYFLCLAKP